tara:strand:- start:104 stop:382 length:279 start_codon:yes stop_codon:yes gene_type:complete
VAIAEVELAVNVIESPSQKTELVEVNEYASEVKLIVGSKLVFIKISGENDEHPPPVAVLVVHDLTLILEPSISVLVDNKLESDLDPIGLSSM